jgi:cytochrome c553
MTERQTAEQTIDDQARNLTDADIEALAEALARQTSTGRTEAARRELNQTLHGQATRRRERSDAGLKNVFGWERPDDGGPGD